MPIVSQKQVMQMTGDAKKTFLVSKNFMKSRFE